MHRNQQTLETFYSAFARLDAETMANCYAPDAAFDDEVFSLRGHEQVAGMWRMLVEATQAKGADVWKLQYGNLSADERSGTAHWEAFYRFSTTGRLVKNIVDGTFDFDEQGRITRHQDRFDFWAWSRQALGMPGVLLGWSPYLRSKVRALAASNLQKYIAARRAAQR